MERTSFGKLRALLFAAMGCLMAGLLLYLWVTPNIELQESRRTAGFETVENVRCQRLELPDAPTGTVWEYRFTLDRDMERDATLAFLFSHQSAEVWLGDEAVYSLRVSDALVPIRTPGSNWAMIPLCREDGGKEVRVRLTPVYRNYPGGATFLIGSGLAIYRAQLRAALPAMTLSLIDVLAGLLLLAAAVYFSVKRERGAGFYALALLAISLGLWNFTQTDFAPLLLREKTVFTYYVSLAMLMACVIPLVASARQPRSQTARHLLAQWTLVCCVVSIAQLLLQLAGIRDLRELLKLTHGMIAAGSLLLIGGSLAERRSRAAQAQRKERRSAVWLLGVGALLDMAVYYLSGGSSGLLFVLLAIFCYVLTEGAQIFFSYTRQKRLLEEKETQLTLSRITAMLSQIRSHFVFNLLNAISGMCKYDPRKADETIVCFARYLRSNIDIMQDDSAVPFPTDLRHVEDYIALEQVRFGDRIRFVTDIETEDFLLPPLILQPLVENAIKHGLTPRPEGGTITLRTRRDADGVRITVEDDGVGFDPDAGGDGHSVGLKNVRFRLEHLMNGWLDIRSEQGRGTAATVFLPMKEAEACM